MSPQKYVQKSQTKLMMENNFSIATLNLCLGLPNKKDMVTECLKNKNIAVCCLQETEIPANFPEEVLNCGGYNLELKLNDEKKRAGIYVSCYLANLFVHIICKMALAQ